MPILKAGELDIITNNAEHTRRLGMRLGALLRVGDVVCLSGDMGAGKTVLAAGIGAGWGAAMPLTSPTFNLVHEHRRERDEMRLYHLDCYRLKSPLDAETIGIDDLLAGRGAVLLEWPERIKDLLPLDRLWVELRVIDATKRNILLTARGERYEQLLEQFRGL